MSKKCVVLSVFMILFCLASSSRVQAAVELQVDVASRYIWRGFDLNPQNKPVLQPSITYAFGDSGFSVNFWGSFSFENKELNETDVTLAYDFKTPETLSLSIGFIHYGWYFTEGFKFKDHTTQEIYVSAGLPKVALAPTLSVYYDINNGDGIYASLGVGHSLSLSEGFSLDLSGTLGYNGKQWIDKSGFSDFTLGASVPIKTGGITISPFVNAVFILMDEVNPEVDNEIVLGVSVAF